MIHPDYKEYAKMIESKLKHATGNLLDLAEAGEFDVIVHGANCFNTMGSGIAREIRERYPEVAAVDAKTRKGDYNKLGTWTEGYAWFDETSDPYTIINAYTQFKMSTGEDVFEYTAFELILQKLARQYPSKRFGFPRIGQGLAKGDPVTINRLLEKFAGLIQSTGGSVTLVTFSSN